MSAQAGVWNFDGKPVDQSFLASFASALEHYGPDDVNSYVDGSTGMVCRTFHTTLESHLERQPYISVCGNVITWDGRLDNRDELIPELWDEQTVDQTDVAIVARAFERWGTECFRRIIGDWAVSVWRPLQRELLLACDYMCIRHLFYCQQKDRIWWSTGLAPLVMLQGDKFHIDDEYVAGYFAIDPDAHRTVYREIQKVPPGQFVRVYDGGLSVYRYWSFSPKSRIRYKTDAEYEDHFRHVFRRAVRRRLRTDSPALAELSGGLDSSSIVCTADDIIAKEGAEAPRLDTLSFYDFTEPHWDDWTYLRLVETKRGRPGHHIDASKLGSSPASMQYSEFLPLPGSLGFGQKLAAERGCIVRNGKYRVVLSGLGGDEFMGGNPDPREILADLIVQLKLANLAQQLIAWSLIKRRPWIQLFWQSLLILLPSSLGQYVVEEAKVPSWINNVFAARTKLAKRRLGRKESFGAWLPSRRSFIGGVLAMSNKMGELTLPSPVIEEIRYPYLDQNLIEFVLSIPASQLLRPGERRSLMRRALIKWVPKEILSRRTKATGARTPIVALQRNWEELKSVFDSPISSSLGYINQPRFLEALRAVTHGDQHNSVLLLRAISLEFWLRDLVTRGLVDGVAGSRSLGVAEPQPASA